MLQGVVLIFKTIVSLLAGGVISTGTVFAGGLAIHHTNGFTSHADPNPGYIQKPLEIASYRWQSVQLPQGGIRSNDISTTPQFDASLSKSKKPLFYPCPFRLKDGSTLGYQLTAAMDMELRIYDIRGNEVFKKELPRTGQGGLKGYNYVPFNQSVLGHSNMPSGVYFFLLLNENDVLGKGKFALLP